LIPELGFCIDVSKKGLLQETPVKWGSTMVVDGLETDYEQMLERRKIASEGLVIALVKLDSAHQDFPIEIIVKGAQFEDKLIDELKENLEYKVSGGDFYGMYREDAEKIIKKTLTRIFYNRIKRCPLIVPIVVE
ncbi:MAG: hypothetical protein J6V69_01320, partial [Clostridia bacterium]|nr:hypothetical protein [Clostridia bacterium]